MNRNRGTIFIHVCSYTNRGKRQKSRPNFSGRLCRKGLTLLNYFFLAALAGLAALLSSSSNAAWAAARRATGTRNGEQLT